MPGLSALTKIFKEVAGASVERVPVKGRTPEQLMKAREPVPPRPTVEAPTAIDDVPPANTGAPYPLAPESEWYADMDYKARGGKLIKMTPDEFLDIAAPLKIDDVARDNIDDLKRHIQEGRTLDPLTYYGGTRARDTDGRHRAIAAKELGIKEVDVLNLSGADIPKRVKIPADPKIDETAAAREFLEVNFKDFDLDQTHQPNFDMIETGEDIKSVIAQTAEANKGKIEEARRGVVTNEQISALANDVGVDETTIRTVLTREAGGEIPPMEVVLASRQVLNDSANRLLTLGKKVHLGQATDVEKLQLRRQLAFHSEYLAGFMGLRADVGRTLGVFKIPVGTESASVKRMQELVETVQGKNLDKIAETLANADSLSGVNSLAKEFQRSKLRGVLESVFTASILSGIRTHEVNFMGNGLFQVMGVTERAVAGQIGRARAATMAALGRPLSPDEYTIAGEASAQLFGMLTGFKDALKLAGRTMKTGESVDHVAKLELPHRNPISAENLEVGGPLGRIVDFLGKVNDIPFRALLVGDEFWKTIGHRADLARTSFREAQIKQMKEGLSDHEMAAYIRQTMENPSKEAAQNAGDWALYSSFQNPLGDNGRAIQGIVNRVPGLKILAPFVRTPTNLVKAGYAERSPLGLFSARIRKEIAAGGPQRDLALARLSMGTMTVATIAALADSDKITGGGPENPQARAVWLLTHEPYSARIYNPVTGESVWQSYQRAEPLAFVIGATADAVEYLNIRDPDLELDSDAEVAQQYLTAIVGGVADNITSKTFLSGLSRFNDAMSDPDRYLDSWVKGMAGAFIPFSGLRRDLAKIEDPMIKEAWTLGEKLRASSGIPGWTESAPGKMDLMGDYIYYPKGSAFGVLSAYPDKTIPYGPVKEEIVRLMDSTNRVPLTMPTKRINGEKLTAQEYHDLVNLSRNEVENEDGETFDEALDTLIHSKVYEKISDDQRVTMVKKLQRDFDKRARQALEAEDEELAGRLQERRSFKLRQKVGKDIAAEIIGGQ